MPAQRGWRTKKTQNKTMSVTVLGVAELDRSLAEFADTMRKNLIRAASRSICKKIVADVKSTAPRKTGALAEAVRVAPMAGSRKGKYRTRGGGVNKIGASVRVGAGFFLGKTFYGGFLEYGTKSRFTSRPLKYVGHVDGERWAFVRPAMERNRQFAIGEFSEALRTAIAAQKKRKARSVAKSVRRGIFLGRRAAG